jgi:hypothetical protein
VGGGGAAGPLGGGGAQVVCLWNIFSLDEIWAQDKTCFGRHFA